MTRVAPGLALALCLVACASAPPEAAHYLLRVVPPADLGSADPLPVALGRISLPPYLDRAGLVVQMDEHQLREARFHLWAESLDEGVWFYLRERISSELGRALHPGQDLGESVRYRVDIRINEFHGTLDGQAHLVARWSVRRVDKDSVVETQRFSQTRRQTGDGYPGLVSTEMELLDELAVTIARTLRTLDLD